MNTKNKQRKINLPKLRKRDKQLRRLMALPLAAMFLSGLIGESGQSQEFTIRSTADLNSAAYDGRTNGSADDVLKFVRDLGSDGKINITGTNSNPLYFYQSTFPVVRPKNLTLAGSSITLNGTAIDEHSYLNIYGNVTMTASSVSLNNLDMRLEQAHTSGGTLFSILGDFSGTLTDSIVVARRIETFSGTLVNSTLRATVGNLNSSITNTNRTLNGGSGISTGDVWNYIESDEYGGGTVFSRSVDNNTVTMNLSESYQSVRKSLFASFYDMTFSGNLQNNTITVSQTDSSSLDLMSGTLNVNYLKDEISSSSNIKGNSIAITSNSTGNSKARGVGFSAEKMDTFKGTATENSLSFIGTNSAGTGKGDFSGAGFSSSRIDVLGGEVKNNSISISGYGLSSFSAGGAGVASVVVSELSGEITDNKIEVDWNSKLDESYHAIRGGGIATTDITAMTGKVADNKLNIIGGVDHTAEYSLVEFEMRGGGIFSSDEITSLEGEVRDNSITASTSDSESSLTMVSQAYGGGVFADRIGTIDGDITGNSIEIEGTNGSASGWTNIAFGGGVYAYSIGHINGGNFYQNSVNAFGGGTGNAEAKGGAFYIAGDRSISEGTRITAGTFSGNQAIARAAGGGTAIAQGGAIFVDAGDSFASESLLVLDAVDGDIRFENNSTTTNGIRTANDLHFGQKSALWGTSAKLYITQSDAEKKHSIDVLSGISTDIRQTFTLSQDAGTFTWGGTNVFKAKGGNIVSLTGGTTNLIDKFDLKGSGPGGDRIQFEVANDAVLKADTHSEWVPKVSMTMDDTDLTIRNGGAFYINSEERAGLYEVTLNLGTNSSISIDDGSILQLGRKAELNLGTATGNALHMSGGQLVMHDEAMIRSKGNITIDSGATMSFLGTTTLASEGKITISDDAILVFDVGYNFSGSQTSAPLQIEGDFDGKIGSQTFVIQNARLNENHRYYLVNGGNGAYTSTGTVIDDDPNYDYELGVGSNSVFVITKGSVEPLTMYWMNNDSNQENKGLWDLSSRNWSDRPGEIALNTTFRNNDSVVFDSAYATTEEDRIIAVTPAGVTVQEMAVAGDGDWYFSGGLINGKTFGKGVTSTGSLTLDLDAAFDEASILAGQVVVTARGSLDAGLMTVGDTGSVSVAGSINAEDALFNGGSVTIESGGSVYVDNGVTVERGGSVSVAGEASLRADDIVVESGGTISVDLTGLVTADLLELKSGGKLDLVAGEEAVIKVGSFTSESGSTVNITGISDLSGNSLDIIKSQNPITDPITIEVNGQDASTYKEEDTYLLVDRQVIGGIVSITPQLVWNMDSDSKKAHGTFNIGTGESFTINGDLANNASIVDSGGGFHDWDGASLKKKGDGTLVLSGQNTYTGGTTIQAGTLLATNLHALGATGNVDVLNGGSLGVQLDGFTDTDMTDLQVLAERVNLTDGAGLSLDFQGEQNLFNLSDDMAIASAARGATFLLSATGKTVAMSDGADIDVKSADFILGADTTLQVHGVSNLNAGGASFAGDLALDDSAQLNAGGNVTLLSGGRIFVNATDTGDIGVLNIDGSFTAQGAVAQANARAATFSVDTRDLANGDVNVILGGEAEYYKNQDFIKTTEGVFGFENLISNFFTLSSDGYNVRVGGMRGQRDILDNLFGLSGATANMYNGADAYDTNVGHLSTSLQGNIEAYIAQMDNTSVTKTQANQAFRQLYGEYGAYARTAQRTSQQRFNNHLANRIDQLRESLRLSAMENSYDEVVACLPFASRFANGIWAGGFGSWANRDSHAGIAGYKYHSGGVILGYDHAVSDSFVLGFSGAYSRGRTKVDDLQTRYDADIMNLGLYGAWFSGQGFFARAGAGFGYGWNDYDTGLALGGKKWAKYKSHSLSGELELGYEVNLGSVNFVPSVGVDVTYVRNRGWDESTRGGNAVALHFSSEHETSVDLPVGFRLNRVWEFGNGCYVAPEVSAAYVYNAGSRPDGVKASYNGASFNWRQNSVATSRHRWQLGAGVKAKVAKNVDLRVDYNVELSRRYQDHNLTASFGVSF